MYVIHHAREKMYLKVRFPALCNLAYKYWIAVKLAERSSSQDLFKRIVILYVAAKPFCKIIVTKKDMNIITKLECHLNR